MTDTTTRSDTSAAGPAQTETSTTGQNEVRATAGRLDYIDMLRGAAALWVVAFHFLNMYYPSQTTPNHLTAAVFKVVGFGQLGVNLFLVVSGFCLFYPLRRRTPVGASLRVDFRQFIGRRAQRILPPYYAMLALLLLWHRAWRIMQPHIPGFPEIVRVTSYGDVVAHFLLLQNWFAQYMGSMSTPLWSIALEWQLYFLFPILVWVGNRRGLWLVAALALVIGLPSQFYFYGLHVPILPTLESWARSAAVYWSLPSRLFEFVMGMLAANYVAHPHRQQTPIALGVFLIAAVVGVPLYLHHGRYGAFLPGVNQVWGVVFAALIVVLDAVHARFPRALNYLHPITVVGTFSYSLYLIHNPIFISTHDFGVGLNLTATTTVLLFLTVSLPLVLAYAFVYYVLFERPFMLRRDRRAQNAAPRIVPGPKGSV